MMETQSGRKTRIYSAADGFREFTDNRTTHLTKIQFIIGMGIVRPELRDEIFCQICKQLTQNRNRQGVQRGWMLMALCLGCFGPSEKFEKYLRCFLRENQPRHYHFYEGKLNRTIKNGVRQWPPNTVEIRAARNRKQIQVRVSLMDKTVHQVKADSATTAKEICLEIASLAGLDEGTYGFGLFISIFQRVSSLGGGREHLMDAIAQCEQISVEHSLAAESAPWQIIFRKEVFSPWYNPMVDPRASQLIRKQIISSLSFGEFPNVSDSKLANFAAQELTIQYGAAWNADAAAKVVREIVPEAKRKAEGPEAWNQKVKAALEKLKKENQLWKTSISSEQVQAHMLRQCRKEFTLPFSRFFQTRPVSRDAKFLSSEGAEMLLAVNWMGVFIVTTSETILANIRFSEIRQIELIRNVRDVPYGFTLETIQEKSFQFICSACEDIDEIVNTFVEGLRARSQFAVGKTDLPQHMVQEGDLACTRGDLIILDQVAGKALLSENEAHGRCERTGFIGNVRSENVWVVPTLLKPDEELVKLFKMTDVELERLNRKTMSAAQMDQTESSAKYYTLQEYAQDFFRNENKGKSSRVSSLSQMQFSV
jgi:myosin VIIa